ncbi:MAG: hypothetical protein HYY17_08410 [Planctomycetes bacterium]|nr:hypothetical protein [Planctomycetota bacterium]
MSTWKRQALWAVGLGAVLAAAACGGGGEGGGGGSSAPAWVKDPRRAVFEGVQDTRAFDQLIGDPAVLFEDGGYKMYYGAVRIFGTPTPRISVGLATSPDGISWARRSQPVLSPGNFGEFDGLFAEAPAVIRRDDGTYLMFYSGNNGISYRIGLATSPDGVMWTKRGVVVDVGAGFGAWDSKSVSDASVVRVGSRYHLYYSGFSFDTNQALGVGLATSDDGVAWTKVSVNAPIFGPAGSTDELLRGPAGDEGSLQPFARWTGSQMELYYTWRNRATGRPPVHIALAVSSDGISIWERRGIVLRAGPDTYDDVGVMAPAVVEVGGELTLWYMAASTVRQQNISRARRLP